MFCRVIDSVSALSSFELLVSPQLTSDAAFLAMSKGMTLLGSTGSPWLLPVAGTVPILRTGRGGRDQHDVGLDVVMRIEQRCGLAPRRLEQEIAGRIQHRHREHRSDLRHDVAAVEIGGRKRSE